MFCFVVDNRIVVPLAADRIALPDRLVLPQRRHVQILRSCRRTRLPVCNISFLFAFATWFSFDLIRENEKHKTKKSRHCTNSFFFFCVLSSSWPPISWMEQTKNPWHWFDFKIFWFGLTSLPFLNYRCAEGYKGQRCENKDIYNLGSKSSVWAF